MSKKPIFKLNRIKAVIVENGSTRDLLAAHLGKSKSAISQWNSNKSQPDLYDLNKIAAYYNIDVKSLLVGNSLVDGESQSDIDIRNATTNKTSAPKKLKKKKK